VDFNGSRLAVNMHLSAWTCMTFSMGGGHVVGYSDYQEGMWGGGGRVRNIVANAMEENCCIVSYSIFKWYIC
jgi:hypothetical protein